ncbi:MAG: catalase [Oligoflexia bacterium]|nr:catalase [Oligoflexia bacterium]
MKNQLTILTIFLVSCSGYHDPNRTISSVNYVSEEQPPVEQGEVWTDREMKAAKLIRNQFRDILEESTGNSELMRRDAHPKHHGCVKANLEIDNSRLKSEYRTGIFSENREYKSIVRFSNGDPNHRKADKKSDVRGMAVKVLDVPYKTYLEEVGIEKNNSVHDFVFMNSSEFFIKDPKHYGTFMDAVSEGGFSMLKFGLGSIVNPSDKFVSILTKAFSMKVGNPLDIDYHSATPYKLGDTSMKMMFKTCKAYKSKIPRKNASNNFLANKLRSYLDKNESCFEFFVQPNQDKRRNNIENAQRKWSTKRSPYYKVGRLTVLKQSKESIDARNESCENLSMNPWRAPTANRPMGGVNRIRLEVYVKQAKMRQDYNGIEYPGPTKFD